MNQELTLKLKFLRPCCYRDNPDKAFTYRLDAEAKGSIRPLEYLKTYIIINPEGEGLIYVFRYSKGRFGPRLLADLHLLGKLSHHVEEVVWFQTLSVKRMDIFN